MTPLPSKPLDAIRPEVTDYDRKAYDTRKSMADAGREAYYAAIRALGPGYDDYAAWHMKDSMGIVPDQVFYCGRKKDGGRGWLPDPPVRFQYERCPGKHYVGAKGQFIGCAFRWVCHLQVIDHRYSPQPPEKLAEARASRERKQILKNAADMPLFQDDVIAGKFPFNKKPRKYEKQKSIS